MATNSTHNHLLLISALLVLTTTTTSATTPKPKALVIPLSRDDTTLQRTINLNHRTPPITTKLTVDLQSDLLLLNCDHLTPSTTNRRIHCGSTRCTTLANTTCSNKPTKPSKTRSCNIIIKNPVHNILTQVELNADVVRINSTDGSNPVRVVSVPRFTYGCVHGPDPTQTQTQIAGFGRGKLSLPSQFSSSFRFGNKFALCVSSSSFTDGFVIFGDKPYNLFPGLDASSLLTYTPLLTNPNPQTRPDYYIGVKSIKIVQSEVKFDKSVLSRGTKISTIDPYTIMQSSIYNAVTNDFAAQVERPGSFAKRVKAIAPFKVCYAVGSLPFTPIGVVVPDINLVMDNPKVVWTISGTNSMVMVNRINAYCLAVVDGGVDSMAAIVIGSYQLENNLLQFDLVNSRIGFSSSLLFSRTRCDNFNFTSV